MTDVASQLDGIAIIIATLGRAEALEVCFNSLVDQTTRPAEVWVVHSGDDIETRALCERPWLSRGLNVRYVAYPRKSAALQRDFAVRQTAQPLILFADDDMEFEPDFVERLLEVIHEDPGVGAAMGQIVNHPMGEPSPFWKVYRLLVARRGRGSLPGAVVGALIPNGFPLDVVKPLRCEWIGGCITLLRKEAYLSVNGFAPHYRGSSPGEDIDLGYRLSKRWKVFYVPAARCLHHQSPLGRESRSRLHFLWMRSRFAFCRSSVGMSAARAWGHVVLWAIFQTVSELSQVRRGTFPRGFWGNCAGRLRGAWSCLGWDPGAERFPEWHDVHRNA
jgi:GT2 family glycosyltransferase